MIGNGFPRQWNLRDHMKRVHNDHGCGGGSPPSVSAGAVLKGNRKRKTEAVAEQKPKQKQQQQQQQQTQHQQLQNASRKAVLRGVPPAKPKPLPSKPLLEVWLDQRREVECMIRGLHKPDDARSLKQIDDVQKRLTQMAKLTKELNPVAALVLAEKPRHPGATG